MIIDKKYLTLQPFKVPIGVLKAGRNDFSWHADVDFFEAFGSSEILAADLDVRIGLDYEDLSIEVEGTIDGTVTVACDRCLEDLVIPVHASFEDEREVSRELDFSQDVYDYVLTSLPMIRTHAEGECNEETTKYLSK